MNAPMRAGGIAALLALAGCAGPARLPAGHYPAPAGPADAAAAGVLAYAPPRPVAPPPGPTGRPFDLPPGFPGAADPPPDTPRFDPAATPAERAAVVAKLYPAPAPLAAPAPPDGAPLTLADLRQLAAANNPVLRRAAADAEAALGGVIQAGLPPNPTVGYQADQIQPALRVPAGAAGSGAGQQGGFVNYLVKTAGKLRLAQQVAGFDYTNAVVAARRAEVDVAAAVRGRYFAVLVARESVAVNRALAALADEVYRLQLAQVAAGQAAGYEPLPLHAQAEQARAAVLAAEAAERGAWRQLAAAAGRPDLPPAPLAGTADADPPAFDADKLRAWALDRHTDVLAARNAVARAEVDLALQRRAVIPDVGTNQYHQYDNLARTYQFGVQVGVELPLADRNQGNVRAAAARLARAAADAEAVRLDLDARLAEAGARYEANRAVAARYRARVLPSLTRAYRALVVRYQTEPARVAFDDVVGAQQRLGQALQAYLAALDAQWKAAVDLAALGQLDDLYPPAP